jgi:signal transduction histidine kinase
LTTPLVCSPTRRSAFANFFQPATDGLDDGGLLPALAGYAQQFMQRTVLWFTRKRRGDECAGASRAIQPVPHRTGSLTNCAKHARARNVTIRLSSDSHRVSLMIADDGVGFDFEGRAHLAWGC